MDFFCGNFSFNRRSLIRAAAKPLPLRRYLPSLPLKTANVQCCLFQIKELLDDTDDLE